MWFYRLPDEIQECGDALPVLGRADTRDV